MKKILMFLPLLAAFALGGCAVPVQPNLTPAQAQAQQTAQLQSTWYVYCGAFKSMQSAITQRIPTAPLAAVQIVGPLSHRLAKECSQPMPANLTTAVANLTQDVTTVVVQLGLQAATSTTTQGAKP